MQEEAPIEPGVEEYDVLIVGTSLTHAILAAALSSAGRTVVHIDTQEFYGGPNACINPPFSVEPHAEHLTDFHRLDGPDIQDLALKREYNVELSPEILYTNSDTIRILRDIGISEYVQFKSMNTFYLMGSAGLTRVPSSKEDIFTSTSMPLITKRRLMKFMKFCADFTQDPLFNSNKHVRLRDFMGEHFRLDSETMDCVAYVLAQASSSEALVSQTVPIINMHIQSLGMFGPFPAVVPMYGGGSELTQAFCRKAAVKGCTYILGQATKGPYAAGKTVSIDSGHKFKARHIVENDAGQSAPCRRRITIVNGDFDDLMGGGDGISIAFVPEQTSDSLHCQIQGSGVGVCPVGQSVIYFRGNLTTTREMFDKCQTRLLKDRACSIITSFDFTAASGGGPPGYDECIAHAREIFHRLMPQDAVFLPLERVADDDDDVPEDVS